MLIETCDAPKCGERLEMYHEADLRLRKWAAETYPTTWVQDWRLKPRGLRVWS